MADVTETARREIHLELLLSKPVIDSTGRPVGRIEEVRAAQQGDEWVIQEYLLGPAALLERLSAWTLGLVILRVLGAHKLPGSYRVPWDRLDLSNVDRPRLTCTLDELKQLSDQLEQPNGGDRNHHPNQN
jgi:sporulation protein YlmC with PRC-barrel domain